MIFMHVLLGGGIGFITAVHGNGRGWGLLKIWAIAVPASLVASLALSALVQVLTK